MNEATVYVFAKWQVKEGNLDTVLKLLAAATAESRKEEGNLMYNSHQSITDPNTLVLFESYKSQAALDEHRNSNHFQSVVVAQIVPLLAAREVIVSTQLNFDALPK